MCRSFSDKAANRLRMKGLTGGQFSDNEFDAMHHQTRDEVHVP
jgi:hypothetical protein